MSVQLFWSITKFFIFLCLVVHPLGKITASLLGSSKGFFENLVLGLLSLTLLSLFLPPWVFLLISFTFWLRQSFFRPASNFDFPQFSWPIWLFIILSVFINSQLLVNFGQPTSAGIALSGAHFIDSAWHIALINSLDVSVPPKNPLFSDSVLSHYHYFIDLQISVIHRLIQVPVPQLFFQIIGPFYLLLFTVILYNFTTSVSGTRIGGLAAILLSTFSSNLYYLVHLVFPAANSVPSVAWIDFFSTKVVNYPLLFSITLILVLLPYLLTSRFSLLQTLILGIFSGLMFGIKSHTAVIWLGIISSLAIYGALKKNWRYLYILLIAILVAFIFLSSAGSASPSLLLFQPLWFIKVMFESPEHFNYSTWELQRQTLLQTQSYLGLSRLYFTGLSWFMFINFGPLLLGFLFFFQSKFSLPLRISFLTAVLSGWLFSLLFIYTDAAIVTIEFAYLSYFFLSLSLALFLGHTSHSHNFFSLATLVIVWSLLLPGTSYIVSQYRQAVSLPSISSSLSSALEFLSQLPPGTLVTSPDLFATVAIPAYSRHSVFVGSSQILSGLGINSSDRENISQKIITCTSSGPAVYALVSNAYLSQIPCARQIYSQLDYSVYKFLP